MFGPRVTWRNISPPQAREEDLLSQLAEARKAAHGDVATDPSAGGDSVGDLTEFGGQRLGGGDGAGDGDDSGSVADLQHRLRESQLKLERESRVREEAEKQVRVLGGRSFFSILPRALLCRYPLLPVTTNRKLTVHIIPPPADQTALIEAKRRLEEEVERLSRVGAARADAASDEQKQRRFRTCRCICPYTCMPRCDAA